MRDFSRTDRVANQLQKEIAVVLQREFKDPRLSMTTVSDVDVSRDLGVAKVHVTFFETDDDKIKQNVKILNDGASFIRTLVAKRVRMRVMPELRFHYDSSLVEGMRISNLVDNVVKGDKQKASDAGRDWDQEEN